MSEQNGGQRSPKARLMPLEHSHQKAVSFWREVGSKSILKSQGPLREIKRRRTRAAQGAKDMALPTRNTTASASLQRGLDHLKNQDGADLELFGGEG